MPEDAGERYLGAARAALAAFGVRPASLALHVIAENITFRLADADDGRDYVLRLHRPGYRSLAALESEHAWTSALRAAGIAVPRSRLSLAGTPYVEVPVDDGGGPRHAGMLEWIPGEPLSVLMRRDGQSADAVRAFGALGTLLARLHRLSEGWRPPAGFDRPSLDAEGLLGEQPLWGRFWEHPSLGDADRHCILAVRRALHARLAALDHEPRHYGVIHADLHTENLVVADGLLAAIDFDDAAHGWYAYDIAVALEPCQDRADHAQLRAALLAGYRALRPFDARDEALLDDFLVVRGLALIGWYLQRPEVEAAEPELFAAIRERTLRQCRAAARPGA